MTEFRSPVGALTLRALSVTALLLAAGCGGGGEVPASGVQAPRPTGTIDGMLVGALRSCRSEDTCAGGSCSRGICTGLVDADALWLQRQLGDRLLRRVEGDADALSELLTKLEALALGPGRAPLPRSRAVAFLARVADPRADAILERAAADTEEAVRLRALLALASRGRGEVVPDLAPLAHDSSEAVRVELARALGPAATDEAVALLRRMAEDDEGPAVRIAAVRALGRAASPAARVALEALAAGGPGYLHHDVVVALRGGG